ncbi:MAG: putative lipopolysaccharide biosynthesis protein [Bacillales bacterium]|jgi:dTDP-4-dehydrorhamnose 3,5-epimerase-like enzyme|nr:putative lipopolysaccharide biosynthesis protein [Bacillales bacterium]
MEITIIEFPIMGDKRGSLISLEQNIQIPFEIKRMYYIFDTKKEVRRGFHAHKNLQQVLFAINGSCKILLDDGREKVDVVLDSRNKGLYIDNLIWREMYDFSDDAVLAVLASDHYNEEDYIRNYADFLEAIR